MSGGKSGTWSKDEGIALAILKWPLYVFQDVQNQLKTGLSLGGLIAPAAAVGLFIGLSQDAQTATDYLLPYAVAGGANYVLSGGAQMVPMSKPAGSKGGGKHVVML